MIIDAHATDTVPSHEVRQRAQQALANAGEPMSEVTYDALRKRLAAAEAENGRLKDAIHDLAKHISRWDWWSLKPETHALVGEKE